MFTRYLRSHTLVSSPLIVLFSDILFLMMKVIFNHKIFVVPFLVVTILHNSLPFRLYNKMPSLSTHFIKEIENAHLLIVNQETSSSVSASSRDEKNELKDNIDTPIRSKWPWSCFHARNESLLINDSSCNRLKIFINKPEKKLRWDKKLLVRMNLKLNYSNQWFIWTGIKYIFLFFIIALGLFI